MTMTMSVSVSITRHSLCDYDNDSDHNDPYPDEGKLISAGGGDSVVYFRTSAIYLSMCN